MSYKLFLPFSILLSAYSVKAFSSLSSRLILNFQNESGFLCLLSLPLMITFRMIFFIDNIRFFYLKIPFYLYITDHSLLVIPEMVK